MVEYGTIDRNKGAVLIPKIKNDNSMSEWLTKARIQDRDSYNAVIEGMNGYSIEDFFRSLSLNIRN